MRRNLFRTLAGLPLFLFNAVYAFAAPGDLDDTYANAPDGLATPLRAVAMLDDGRHYVAGGNRVDGPLPVYLLDAHGSPLDSFNPPEAVDASVYDLAPLNDGKLLVAGHFRINVETPDGSQIYANLVCLNADGSLDTGFNTGFLYISSPANRVYGIDVAADGRIAATGSFDRVAETSREGVAIFNADGSLDATFAAETGFDDGGAGRVVRFLPDGKLMVGGRFERWQGNLPANLTRLLPDGGADPDFFGVGANATVHEILLQADGRILVGGDFDTFNGEARGYLVRLDANGLLDTTFNPWTLPEPLSPFSIAGGIDALALGEDGLIYARGGSWHAGTQGVERLRPNGDYDPMYDFDEQLTNKVLDMALDPEGRLVIVGERDMLPGPIPPPGAPPTDAPKARFDGGSGALPGAPVITGPGLLLLSQGQEAEGAITATNDPTSYGVLGGFFFLQELDVDDAGNFSGLISSSSRVYFGPATATNAVGLTSGNLRFSVAETPVFTNAPLELVVETGDFVNEFLSIQGNSGVDTRFSAEGLPPGLSLSFDGNLQGSPTETGNYPITFRATNHAGAGTQEGSITVFPEGGLNPPVIVGSNSASAQTFIDFAFTIETDPLATTFSAIGLPDGLSLHTGTGVISGQPTEDGEFEVTLNVSNAVGSDEGTLFLSVTVGPPVFDPAADYEPTVGIDAGFAFDAQTLNPFTSFTFGHLPPELEATGGSLSGQIRAEGRYDIAMNATNEAGSRNRALIVTVGNPAADDPVLRGYQSTETPDGGEPYLAEWGSRTFPGGNQHGLLLRYWPNGEIFEASFWEFGLREGETRLFFEDGTPAETANYSEGVLDGDFARFWEDGDPREAGRWEAGNRVGEWAFYEGVNNQLSGRVLYEEGQEILVLEENSYFDDGRLEEAITRSLEGDNRREVTRTFRQDGTPIDRVETLNGALDGRQESYFENGQLRLESIFAGGLRNGLLREFREDGSRVSEVQYENGQRSGEGTFFNASDQLTSEGVFAEDERQGLWAFYEDDNLDQTITYEKGIQTGPTTTFFADGRVASRVTYQDNVRHGPASFYATTSDGRHYVSGSGRYSDGGTCGIWTVTTVDPDGALVSETEDRGPCGPPPPKVLDDPTQAEIRGTFTNLLNGEPIPGVRISIEPNGGSASTDANGFFSTVIEKRPYSVTITHPDFRPVTQAVGDFTYADLTRALRAKLVAKPSVVSVETQYAGFFLTGLGVENEFTVNLDWLDGTPGTIDYQVAGMDESLSAPDDGSPVIFSLTMGNLPAGRTDANRIRLRANNGQGVVSDPFEYYPVVVPLPSWSTVLGGFGLGEEVEDGVFAYPLEVSWPEEPFEFRITRDTLGSTLWNLWGFIPFIGGRELGIPPTQATLEMSAQTDGTGSISLTGTTAFEVGGQSINGKAGGEGALAFSRVQGLFVTEANALLGVDGSIEIESPVADLVPALRAARNSAIVGKVIRWLTNAVIVEGAIAANADLSITVFDETGSWGLHGLEGTVGAGMKAGLRGDFSVAEAWIEGRGEGTVTGQVPANPSYFKSAEATLTGTFGYCAWLYDDEFEISHTFTTEDEGASFLAHRNRLLAKATTREPQPRDMGFTRTPGFQTWMGKTRAIRETGRRSRAAGEPVDPYMSAVYPDAVPALAGNATRRALLWLSVDPALPAVQSTNLAFAQAAYGEPLPPPAPLTEDSHADLAPDLGALPDGSWLVAWQRIARDHFEGDITAFAAELEVVATVMAADGTTSGITPLSDNGFLDNAPKITGSHIAWMHNPDNDLTGSATSPSRLNLAILQPEGGFLGLGGDAEFTVPSLDFTDVLSWDFAAIGDALHLVWSFDTDGDPDTVGDLDIALATYADGAWTTESFDATDAIDLNPKLVEVDGAPRVVWQRGADLVWSPLDSTEIEVIRAGAVGASFTNFDVSVSPGGHILLTFAGMAANRQDLFYSVYDPAAGAWGEPLALTATDAVEDAYTGVWADADTLAFAWLGHPTPGPQTPPDLYETSRTLGADIALAAVALPERLTRPGETAVLEATVRNQGDFAITAGSLEVYRGDPEAGGSLLERRDIDLLPGESATLAFEITFPKDPAFDGRLTFIAEVPDSLADTDPANDRMQALLKAPDLTVLSMAFEPQGFGLFRLSARVANHGTAEAENVRLLWRDGLRDIATIDIPRLRPGESAEFASQERFGTAFFDWPQRLETLIDAENAIAEFDETNNRRVFLPIPGDLAFAFFNNEAEALPNGSLRHPQAGEFFKVHFPWLRNEILGWHWVHGGSVSDYWLLRNADNQWYYARATLSPHVYSFARDAWLYLATTKSGAPWAYNYATAKWEPF